jgi:membrane associated rhomboid family serine protease
METNELQRSIMAVVIPLFLVFLMYMMKVLEVGMNWNFIHLGVYPLSKKGIFGIFAHPLVHSSFKHLFANTIPFFFLSWCLFYFYRDIASSIFFIIWVGCGIVAFLIGKEGWHVGASGVIYGLVFFLFFSGIIRKHVPLIAISLLVAFVYGGLIWNMFPLFAKPSTSWEGHFGGAITGTICAYFFRRYGPQKPEMTDDEEAAEKGEEKTDCQVDQADAPHLSD